MGTKVPIGIFLYIYTYYVNLNQYFCTLYRFIRYMENNLLKRIVGMACLLLLLAAPAKAQFTYGTTGLLHMPTADMQQDKTLSLNYRQPQSQDQQFSTLHLHLLSYS